MTLTDIMSGSGYALLQTAASVVFFAAFGAVVLYALLRPREEIRRQAHLPLEDDPPASSVPRNGD